MQGFLGKGGGQIPVEPRSVGVGMVERTVPRWKMHKQPVKVNHIRPFEDLEVYVCSLTGDYQAQTHEGKGGNKVS